jgi:hypothetical protein
VRIALERSAIAVLALVFVACIDPCENTVSKEVASPDGRKKAVVFERSCGATTGFSLNVSVQGNRKPISQSAGNVFIADSDHGAVKQMDRTVRWASSDRLVVVYPSGARLFKRESRKDGVTVAYEQTR